MSGYLHASASRGLGADIAALTSNNPTRAPSCRLSRTCTAPLTTAPCTPAGTWCTDMKDFRVNIPAGKIGTAEIDIFDITDQGAMMFNVGARGRLVKAGRYTRLKINRELMMTDTPAEQRDHWYPLHNATGSVLITGLGIGMVVSACLQNPAVTDVTVIEINPDVIALVGPHISSPKLTIINADALDWKPPKGKRYDLVWHDIWPDICGDNLPEMAKLKRRFARRTEWQGCWAQEQCRRSR